MDSNGKSVAIVLWPKTNIVKCNEYESVARSTIALLMIGVNKYVITVRSK